MDDDDAAIAEFHAAARRRHVRIFAIAGILSVAIGIAALLVAFLASDATGPGGRFEVKTIVVGIAFVAAGIGSCWNAVRTGRGEHVE